MRVAGKEATREAQNRGRGYCRVAGLARSGPGAARAWIQVSARKHGIPLLDGVFPARAEADIASDTPQIEDILNLVEIGE